MSNSVIINQNIIFYLSVPFP